MKRSTTIGMRWLTALIISFSLILAGCGSDSSSDGGGATTNTLTGTAATGAAIDGYVYVVDINGSEINVAISTDGSFSADVSGMSAPFALRAVPNDTSLDTQYSYAASSGVTVNITPMTSLAFWMAGSQSDLAGLATAAAWPDHYDVITEQNLTAAVATINANFETQLSNLGLENSYNFFNQSFSANSTGIDAFLDTLAINIDMTGGAFTVQVSGSSFSFNSSIDTSNVNVESGNTNNGDAGGSSTLPAGVAGQVVTMEFCCAASGALYNNGDQVLFAFSSSGSLMLTEQSTVVSSSFTVDSFGQYIWVASDGTQYVLSLNNGAIHEVNVMSSGNVFMGQFAPVSNVSGNTDVSGDTGSTGSDAWNLTITGTTSIAVFGQQTTVNIPATTIENIAAPTNITDVQTAISQAYATAGINGTITVIEVSNTSNEISFSASFDGVISGVTTSYSLLYTYTKL